MHAKDTQADASLTCFFSFISNAISLTSVDFRFGGSMSFGASQNWVQILLYHDWCHLGQVLIFLDIRLFTGKNGAYCMLVLKILNEKYFKNVHYLQ